MVKYNFKDIGVVPSATEFVDIMLSRTNRQTPTVVRARWRISSIRSFYMRKVKFTQQNMTKRLTKILAEFPKLDSIHPFYSDLMNVLYDRDHYKIALSQLNIARQLIINLGRDYHKLLKYGDSLYRCKHLKRAALGRMVKILRQQKASLLYLEQVRQHIGRLPTIDPYQKTILLTGFPSCGKSSFINKITRANVEVASYPFTTKSLYVGHCDYNYLRYQIIDSPGILDQKPLSERNTIEMQAITALAHLNALILFIIDLSPLSQYSIQAQVQLFHSLLPLFNQKPCIIVCNKTDLRSFDSLSNQEKNLISKLNKKILTMSAESGENVMNVRNEACDMLLSHRIEIKTAKGGEAKLKAIEHRLFVAKPVKRDNKIREITIPKKSKGVTGKTIKQIEAEAGGPGVFNFDTRQHWELKNDEWKFDPIPQFYNGKNIADFYQPNIAADLDELEKEEMNIDVVDHYDPRSELNEDDNLLNLYILRKHTLMRKESAHITKMRDSRPQIPRPDQKISVKKLKDKLEDLGIKTHKIRKTLKEEEMKKDESLYHRRGRSRYRKKSQIKSKELEPVTSKQSGLDFQEIARRQSRSRSAVGTRSVSRRRSKSRDARSRPPSKGISSISASEKAQKLKRKAITALHRRGKVHESDRRIDNLMPMHLFKGKHKPKGR